MQAVARGWLLRRKACRIPARDVEAMLKDLHLKDVGLGRQVRAYIALPCTGGLLLHCNYRGYKNSSLWSFCGDSTRGGKRCNSLLCAVYHTRIAKPASVYRVFLRSVRGVISTHATST